MLVIQLAVAMLGSGSINALIERVAYRPLRTAPKLAPLITAVGFSFILQNVGLLWKGGSQQGIPDLINAQHNLVTVFGVTIVLSQEYLPGRMGMAAGLSIGLSVALSLGAGAALVACATPPSPAAPSARAPGDSWRS